MKVFVEILFSLLFYSCTYLLLVLLNYGEHSFPYWTQNVVNFCIALHFFLDITQVYMYFKRKSKKA